ncbi:hypothetical protein [Alteribacillus iranensis]|uniref:Uncharacterized protein n=1 Tax=Alteribacillus iranensis TaxID=930128 RepID=A0A1I2BVW3_9BACI|nr:hypothetical protein [Alteribacillus iranensis]SFE60217.1 hypothetical protein SAMN05192532_102536 [Alteribacillus iranensis]
MNEFFTAYDFGMITEEVQAIAEASGFTEVNEDSTYNIDFENSSGDKFMTFLVPDSSMQGKGLIQTE